MDQTNYSNALQTAERALRSQVVSKEIQKAGNRSSKKQQQEIVIPAATKTGIREELASLTPFQPVWVEEELFLVRQVRGSRSNKYQGVWLDHAKLKEELTEQIPSELTGARLIPLITKNDDPMGLVTLPWQLDTLPLVIPPLALTNPVYKTLMLAWVAALISLAALGLLLRAVLKLSERRAAFVSSVTHELRTPLTTFRLYSEMLAEGMVTDGEQKQEYLRTMLSESERLNHWLSAR
jgi:signal transduction histidine kinase